MNSFCLIKKGEEILGGCTLCQFSSKDGPLTAEELDQFKDCLIPGLKKHKDPFQSSYGLVTAHTVIPSCSKPEDLDGLYYVPTGSTESQRACELSEEKYYLADIVTGGISCCGEDSAVGPECKNCLKEHKQEGCHIGYDFTILFLKDGVIDTSNLPQICMNPNREFPYAIASYRELDQLLEVNTTSDEKVLEDDAESDVAKQLKDTVVDTGVVIVTAGADGSSSTVKLYVHRRYLREDLQQGRPRTINDQLEIFTEIQRLRYVVPPDIDILPGSPILYKDESSGQCTWIGMHVVACDDKERSKCEEGVSLFSIQMLLLGGPVPLLSLLGTYHTMRRLWVNKYEHLLMPYFDRGVFVLGDRLEVLYFLLKSHCGAASQVLDIRDPDPTETKIASFRLLTALLKPFSYKEHDVAAVAANGGGVLNKPEEKEDFVTGLKNIIANIKYFVRHPSNNNTAVEECLLCISALLNLNFDDLVTSELKTEGPLNVFDDLETLVMSDRFTEMYKIQSLYWEIKFKTEKRKSRDKRQYLAEQSECFQNKLSETEKERDDFQDKLRDTEKERDDFQDKLRDTEKERDNLQDKLTETKKERDDKLRETEKERDDFKHKLSEMEKERDVFQDKLKETEKERDDKLRTAKKERDDFQDKLSETKKKRDDFQDKLSETKKERDDFQDKLRETKKERDDFQDKLSETKKERDDFQDKLSDTKKERDDFQDKLSETKRERDDKLRETEKERDDFQDKLRQAEKKRDGLREEMKELAEKIGHSQEQLKEMQQQRDDLQEQVKELTNKLATAHLEDITPQN